MEKKLCFTKNVQMGDFISINFCWAVSGPGWLVYIKHAVLISMSLFHEQTAIPISTKFFSDLHTNSGKVLNTRMTLPTQPPDPGTPNSKT